MAIHNNQMKHGSSRVAMIGGFGGSKEIPFDSEKLTGEQHALTDGHVDELARQLRGLSVATVLEVLGDGEAQS